MQGRSFAHTERPQGGYEPQHRASALNALSNLARRGDHDVEADHIRQPLQAHEQRKPPSPVVQEVLERLRQQQAPPMEAPMEAHMEAPPMEAPMPEMPMDIPQGREEFIPPPDKDYYRNRLVEIIEERPVPEGQPDWRKDAVKKFANMEESLERVREHVRQLQQKLADV